MIRLLSSLSKTGDKPPFHAVNGHPIGGPIVPAEHRHVGPRRNIVQRPKPAKTPHFQAQQTHPIPPQTMSTIKRIPTNLHQYKLKKRKKRQVNYRSESRTGGDERWMPQALGMSCGRSVHLARPHIPFLGLFLFLFPSTVKNGVLSLDVSAGKTNKKMKEKIIIDLSLNFHRLILLALSLEIWQ